MAMVACSRMKDGRPILPADVVQVEREKKKHLFLRFIIILGCVFGVQVALLAQQHQAGAARARDFLSFLLGKMCPVRQ
jgi:hypothetical protein